MVIDTGTDKNFLIEILETSNTFIVIYHEILYNIDIFLYIFK